MRSTILRENLSFDKIRYRLIDKKHSIKVSNMEKEADKIVQTLKSKGLRVTPQRFAVYSNLLNRQDHPTAEQILISLNKNSPTSSLATIYSSLQALRDVGLVREVLLEEGVCRYDANVSSHHHFRCKKCGSIEDILWQQVEDISFRGLRSGLTVEQYELTVQGVCDKCQGSQGKGI